MAAHIDPELFKMLPEIPDCVNFLSQKPGQMAAAGQAMQIVLPFFEKCLPERFLAVHDSQPRHDRRIEKIVFKGVIFEDQDIAAADSGKLVNILLVPFLIIPAQLGSQLFGILAVPVPDHQELIPQIDLIHVL